MNEKILIDCGLSLEQAKVYTYLLNNAFSSAKVIASKTGIGRALTYKIIDQLIILNLAEKREDIGKITLFLPKHPRNIKEMIESKKQSLNHASTDLSTIFGAMSSEFNALSGKPNIQFYEGVEGIERVHEDILDIGQNILVMSSPIVKISDEQLRTIIKKQIAQQAKQKINTRAITPLHENITEERIVEDKENLITRKKVSAEKLNIPAQIIIYGDKVSITNFKESILTVVIESKYIAETFRIMFEYIWENSK